MGMVSGGDGHTANQFIRYNLHRNDYYKAGFNKSALFICLYDNKPITGMICV